MLLREQARRILTIITLRSLVELGVAAVAAFAFVQLALEVVEHDADAFDARIAHWIRASLDSHAADSFFSVITHAGSGPVLTVATVVAAVVALRRGFRWIAVVLVVNGLVTDVLQALLKNLVARDRPNLDPLIALPASFSFPSGHAMASLAILATIAYALGRTLPRGRAVLASCVALLVFAVGLSRVYLGVHWPLDVIAGYLAGVPLFAVSVHVMRRLYSKT